MPTPLAEFRESLKSRAPEFGINLQPAQIELLTNYYELVRKWNPRLHLVAPCSPAEFAGRHVLESLVLLKHLPRDSSIVDVGSGAGLPGVPCLLVRDDLSAILIESSRKKGVFLGEALRALASAPRARLIVSRFEAVAPPPADFLTCRALDKFSELFPRLVQWAPSQTTFLIFAGEKLRDQVSSSFPDVQVEQIPGSERRFLVIARR